MFFYYAAAALEPTILALRPRRVLEISMSSNSGSRYGRLISNCQRQALKNSNLKKLKTYIDRIDLEAKIEDDTKPYDRILPISVLDDTENMDNYDLIMIADLIEKLGEDTVKTFVLECLGYAKLLLIITMSNISVNDIFVGEKVSVKSTIIQAIPNNFTIHTITNSNTASKHSF